MPTTFHRSFAALGDAALLWEATAPERLPELHPLIHAVSDVTGDERDQSFLVHEHVPLGPLRLPNRYRTRRVAGNPLLMEAWASAGVHLVHTLTWREDAGRLHVDHVVAVDAHPLVAGFVERTARAAHDRWIEAVRGWMAAESVRRACGGRAAARSTEPYRQGLWSVLGERAGYAWEVLVGLDGAVLTRVTIPGLALDLAATQETGPGGSVLAGYSPAPADHPLAGRLLRGEPGAFAALPPRVRARLVSPEGREDCLLDGRWVAPGDPAVLLSLLPHD